MEVFNGCMVLFTSDTFYAGVIPWDRKSGTYLSYLRILTYIVGQNYLSNKKYISSINKKTKCKSSCNICKDIPTENIHHKGRIVKYLDNDYNIDKLQMTTVLLGDLEKVGWVVLKCDF